MSGNSCGATAVFDGPGRASVGSIREPRTARLHSVRQRLGVHGPGSAGMASADGGEDFVHRAREPLGEWAFVGGFIGRALGFYGPNDSAGFVASVIGAMVLLFIYRMAKG